MFCSGAETRRLLAKENRRNTFLLLTVSDLASFALVLGLGFAHLAAAEAVDWERWTTHFNSC